MGNIDKLELADIELVFASDVIDLCRRPNEGRFDNSGFCRLDRTAKRSLITRMDDNRIRRRHPLRLGDQPVVFRLGPMSRHTGYPCGRHIAISLGPHL